MLKNTEHKMTAPAFTVTSYNIHKGKSAVMGGDQIEEMTAALKTLDSDIFFLQEVQGLGRKRRKDTHSHHHAHDKILARSLNYYTIYGKNAIHAARHHGNAILSREPITEKTNFNLTINKLEQRSLLHCAIIPPGWKLPVECLCVHLNLMEQDRETQYRKIVSYLREHIADTAPVILAGDFNDWRHKSQNWLAALGFSEVFLANLGSNPKTFPAKMPLLSLDRIYIKNLIVVGAAVHNAPPWTKLSDHLPLTATLTA